jgi:hypothetical protein
MITGGRHVDDSHSMTRLGAHWHSAIGTAVLLGVLLCQAAGCGQATEPIAVPSDVSPTPRAFTGSGSTPSSAAARDFITFALNALLLPLLDDDVPARWADPSIAVDCNDAHVTVDGAHPGVGSNVPSAFTVLWHMDRCTPLGQGLELSGDVDLRVVSTADGYTAHVHPRGLKLISIAGEQTLTEPFTATLEMIVGVHR